MTKNRVNEPMIGHPIHAVSSMLAVLAPVSLTERRGAATALSGSAPRLGPQSAGQPAL